MIMTQMELEFGFRKADMNNIPTVGSAMIFDYASKLNASDIKVKEALKTSDELDYRVDFVQLRRSAEICEIQCIVFPAMLPAELVRVSIKLDLKKDEIFESSCSECSEKDMCQHIIVFIFWMHRKSTDKAAPAICEFWGFEYESLADDRHSKAIRLRDMISCEDLRHEIDTEMSAVSSAEGEEFLDAILNEMEDVEVRDSAFYRHFRSTIDEYEPLFVHHTLLEASKHQIHDTRSFGKYMEDVAIQGLFDQVAEVSKNLYKSPLWLEVQYMRLRCSLIHRIASRKDSIEDEQILEMLFCKDREKNVEERQQLKQHKRFILKQTEKLENKTYFECGLLLSESYPYICAAPDGITDDHIVEIKAPKTDEEFEKYLEGRETIAPKYMAQIQIQMYMANVTKALYCVLSPTFDTNGALHYVWVQADMEFVASLLSMAEDFWKEVVFPRLAKNYLGIQ